MSSEEQASTESAKDQSSDMTAEERKAAAYFNTTIEILAKGLHRLIGCPGLTLAVTVSMSRKGEGGIEEVRPLTCLATSYADPDTGLEHVKSVAAVVKRMIEQTEAGKAEDGDSVSPEQPENES